MGFGVVRLSASWREIDEAGYQHLDWLIEEATSSGQRVVLAVGMKALGWPEFYVPERLEPQAPFGSDVARGSLGGRTLKFVRDTVMRYRTNSNIVAWQLENEPFNRSGPHAWWLGRRIILAERQIVESLDPRPVIVTTFVHFSAGLDRASTHFRSDWMRRLGLDVPAEREALATLRRDDILGLDVYRAIGWWKTAQEQEVARSEDNQLDHVRRWQRIAREQRKHFWITEAQAEPWEASSETHADPLSVRPTDMLDLAAALVALEVEVVLLWGSEYWVWREQHGDARWIESAAEVLGRVLIS
ncbi:MAG: hypothetical protein M3Z11_11520 [Candidatus Dormibacteraeota bacterium]|nr:hypothetical protein [Candidatus Dormibacteraeota bacterium]